MKTVTYSIPGISCSHCVHTIQSELSELVGVKEVVADAGTKSVTVTFESPTTEDTLKALLVEINYPVAG